MKLKLSPRNMLIARMQVFVYNSVLQGDYATAERLADATLASFDATAEYTAKDALGYWSGAYFQRFADDCKAEGITG